MPIDRYFIEGFLRTYAGDIRGRVLEVGDNSYTLRFGGSKVERAEVLHVDPAHHHADYVGDLSRPDVLPTERFDCIVLTQTLHLIFDMRAAVATLHRALKPGGILLLTTPGISQIDKGQWAYTWQWSLTPVSARQLLEEQFRPDSIAVSAYGNVFAAICFLQGIAVEEVTPAELDATSQLSRSHRLSRYKMTGGLRGPCPIPHRRKAVLVRERGLFGTEMHHRWDRSVARGRKRNNSGGG